MNYDIVNELSLNRYPRQEFRSGDQVLNGKETTDRLMLVVSGMLRDVIKGNIYCAGDLVSPVDFFGTDVYRDKIISTTPSTIVLIPRSDMRDLLISQAPTTWAMARMVAIEICSQSTPGVMKWI